MPSEAALTALTVEVPETLEAWVRQPVERGDYASAEDYLRDNPYFARLTPYGGSQKFNHKKG
jgi:hypothetical protein